MCKPKTEKVVLRSNQMQANWLTIFVACLSSCCPFSLIPYIVNYFRCTSFPVEILAARARFNESSVLLGVTWINKLCMYVCMKILFWRTSRAFSTGRLFCHDLSAFNQQKSWKLDSHKKIK